MKNIDKDDVKNPARRKAFKTLSTVAGGASLVATEVWQKPVIRSIALPAHAATSTCPVLEIAAATQGTGSGQPPICPIQFQIRSADPDQPVDIISIVVTNLGALDSVSLNPQSFPAVATNTEGVQVSWQGEAATSPFSCNLPLENTTFTVQYNCSVNEEVLTQVFTLDEDVIPVADGPQV